MGRRGRKRKRTRRTVVNLGATPPRMWRGEVVLECPGAGRRTYKVPGPTVDAAVRNVSNPARFLPMFAVRCRITKRRIVGK